MKLIKLTPLLYTAELRQTVDFYVQKLGFTCVAFDDGWGWASLQRDGAAIMLSLPNEHIPFQQAQFTGSFYFNTDDVEELWQQLKDTVRVVYPLEDFEYGMKEFAVYDNNGYVLQFGQEIDSIGQ